MRSALVTGGSGFFGERLTWRLVESGTNCVNIDLRPSRLSHPLLRSVQGDITNPDLLDRLFSENSFDAVFHCAAVVAHAVRDTKLVWRFNVEGTRQVAQATADHGVPKLVFISSNCLWGTSFRRPVSEEDEPRPVETYGRSKWQAEKIVLDHSRDFDTTVLRSPTIMGSGRLGLASILFDFIREGRRVWVVGKGENRYQFVAADDLVQACVLAVKGKGSTIYNVGSDDVKPLREVYEYVIRRAGTGARVTSLPERPALAAMALADALGLSPLGPYHRRMIRKDFLFDTSRIKDELGWRPTQTNEEMLAEAYRSYERDYEDIRRRTGDSPHRQPAAMGAIRILKWLS